jgi:hypothetical protein
MRPFLASFDDYENVVALATTRSSFLMKLHLAAMPLAAAKVQKTIKFAGGTAKNAKIAKRVAWAERSARFQ